MINYYSYLPLRLIVKIDDSVIGLHIHDIVVLKRGRKTTKPELEPTNLNAEAKLLPPRYAGVEIH